MRQLLGVEFGQTRTQLAVLVVVSHVAAQATRRTSEQGEVVRPIQDVQSWRVPAVVGGQ